SVTRFRTSANDFPGKRTTHAYGGSAALPLGFAMIASVASRFDQEARQRLLGVLRIPADDRVLGAHIPSRMPGSVEEVGLSLVVLSLVFASAALIRRWSRPLRKLFIPTAVIGGFLVLGLGPEGLGRIIGGTGLFPESVFATWRQMPGYLVTL